MALFPKGLVISLAVEQRDLKSTTTQGNVIYPNCFGTSTSDADISSIQLNPADLTIELYRYDAYNRFIRHKVQNNGGGEMSDVNWQEKYLDSLNSSIKEIKEGLVSTENRISDTINKYIEYSTHLDKQRHEELLNLNNKIDNSIDKINDKIDNTNKWLIGLVITTILGIAAMVLTAIFAN